MSALSTLLVLTLGLYLAGAVVLGANLLLRRPGLLLTGRGIAIGAALVHAALIGVRCATMKHAPFATSTESLSALAWMVGLAYLASETLWRLSASGPFALGLAFLLTLCAALLPESGAMAAPPAALSSGIISLHITAVLAAFGAFALAFCCAALYLIEHHILKSKHGISWLKRLPPLMTVENAAFSLVAFGFPTLTLGLLAGLLNTWANPVPGGWHTSIYVMLAYVVWAVYGTYLLARLAARWPPVRTSYVLLVGLALCLLLFFVPSAAHRLG